MDFKDHFDFNLAEELAVRAQFVHPGFDLPGYRESVPADLLNLEMKGRVRALSNALWSGLNVPFVQAAALLCNMLGPIEQRELPALTGFPAWVIADIVEEQGVEYFDAAMRVIHQVTQHFTGEFAIRPFLRNYPSRTFETLGRWVDDDSYHVRRLVSEGCRPRLPWATQVPALLQDPAPVLALIERLYNDPTEYVRRSVANNLNDIAKDYPQLVLDTLSVWRARDPNNAELDWIIRHGLRSLARQGHQGALELLGYPAQVFLSVADFSVTPVLRLGESLQISCQLLIEQELAGLMIDYAIISPGVRGKMNRRVFKWSKRKQVSAGIINVERSHSIESRASRSYNPGNYQIELIINGKVKARSNCSVRE